jgi:FkbM family methyltransferase
VRLSGVRLDVTGLAPEMRRAIYAERYERGEARCLLKHLRAGDVVIEAGAGIGFLSALCALRIGSERVFSYEANPRLRQRIAGTHQLNGVGPEVTFALLGDAAGEREFFVADRLWSSSTLDPSEGGDRIVVPTLDLNREISRRGATLLLLDVEGGESDLLPAIRWQGVRKLVIELHPHLIGAQRCRELVELLAAAGFREDRRVSSTRKKYVERPATPA